MRLIADQNALSMRSATAILLVFVRNVLIRAQGPVVLGRAARSSTMCLCALAQKVTQEILLPIVIQSLQNVSFFLIYLSHLYVIASLFLTDH